MIDSTEWFSIVNARIGQKLNLVLHRIKSWDLYFLAYINDLPDGLTTNAKFFADDTLFSPVFNDFMSSSASLNNNSLKISQWAYQWKMIFDPDVSKQFQQVIFFSPKEIATNHATVYFNIDPVIRKNFQKHLELLLLF